MRGTGDLPMKGVGYGHAFPQSLEDLVNSGARRCDGDDADSWPGAHIGAGQCSTGVSGRPPERGR
jgi:hypothetical protein